jgi:GDP-mannose 6-dehydrogenase
MRVSIFGLGYVGAVSAACLAKEGHTVIGVDVDSHKLDLIRQGKAPIVEANLEPYLQQAVESGRLTVTDDPIEAVHNTEISLLCVGTPSKENGDLRTDYLERVARQIGEALITKRDVPHRGHSQHDSARHCGRGCAARVGRVVGQARERTLRTGGEP